MNTFRLATIAAVAVTTLGLSIAPAIASIPAQRVAYGDLRLDTDQGKHVLASRVSHAVSRVCDINDAPLSPSVRACRQEARARATDDLGRAGIAL